MLEQTTKPLEIENNARLFAQITQQANEIAPLLSQTFKIKLRGSASDMDWCVDSQKRFSAKYLGKPVDCKVRWDITENSSLFIVETIKEGQLLQFTESEFYKYVVQVGLAPRMVAAWKLTLN